MAFGWLFILTMLTTARADDAPVRVVVELVDEGTPKVHRCAAWASAEGFRTDPDKAAAVARSERREGRWTCVLTLPRAGTYAVAVVDDANDNGKLDTNWLGVPTEGWGVSKNVKPATRAPRFDECAVSLSAGSTLRIEVRR